MRTANLGKVLFLFFTTAQAEFLLRQTGQLKAIKLVPFSAGAYREQEISMEMDTLIW